MKTLVEYTKQLWAFHHFKDGTFWYCPATLDKEFAFLVPVPVEDVGNGELKDYEKGIVLMKWIRKYLKMQKMEPEHVRN
jgi:hypothetical protein